jgi:hypothetical protein
MIVVEVPFMRMLYRHVSEVRGNKKTEHLHTLSTGKETHPCMRIMNKETVCDFACARCRVLRTIAWSFAPFHACVRKKISFHVSKDESSRQEQGVTAYLPIERSDSDSDLDTFALRHGDDGGWWYDSSSQQVACRVFFPLATS